MHILNVHSLTPHCHCLRCCLASGRLGQEQLHRHDQPEAEPYRLQLGLAAVEAAAAAAAVAHWASRNVSLQSYHQHGAQTEHALALGHGCTRP